MAQAMGSGAFAKQIVCFYESHSMHCERGANYHYFDILTAITTYNK